LRGAFAYVGQCTELVYLFGEWLLDKQNPLF